jgi:hypothetical protein
MTSLLRRLPAVCLMVLGIGLARPGWASCPFSAAMGCPAADYMIYPESGTTRLPEWMVAEFNAGAEDPEVQRQSLRLARNEIYARRGYIFQDQDLQAYFNGRSWYRPLSRQVRLNPIETYNVTLIRRVEQTLRR